MEKRRRRRKVVLLRKRLGLSEHSFWNKVSVSHRRDRQQYERSQVKRERKIEPRQCARPLDLQNKIMRWLRHPPLSLPFPGGVSSPTWTAGESRAVLFFLENRLLKKAKAGFGD